MNHDVLMEPDPIVSFRQYIADNIDWNSATLDRKGSIHVQGMMGGVTPGLKSTPSRVQKTTPTSEQLKNLIAENVKYISAI